MQQNYLNNCSNQCYPVANPNAVNINIISPQAYGQAPACQNDVPQCNSGYYSMYGANTMPNLPLYPQNYNAPIYYNNLTNPISNPYQAQQGNPAQFGMPTQYPDAQQNQLIPNNQANLMKDLGAAPNNQLNEYNSIEKSKETSKSSDDKKTDKKDEKEKTITPLTDDYIKNLENYLDSNN